MTHEPHLQDGQEQEFQEQLGQQQDEQPRLQALENEALRKRLLEEAAMLTTALPIDRIVVDETFQIRDSLNLGAVQAYRRRYLVGSYMPPIEVANVDGAYYLIDGYHRLEALRLLDKHEVLARIRSLPTIEEAMWIGGEINSAHGVKLTREERRKRFKLYLRMGRHFIPGKPQTIRWVKSYRKIGEDFGITHPTAEKLVKWADRKLWQALAERGQGQLERSDSGGLRVSSKLRPEDLAKRNLDNARAAFQGIETPEARGEVIAKADAVAQDMKKGKPWTPFPENEF